MKARVVCLFAAVALSAAAFGCAKSEPKQTVSAQSAAEAVTEVATEAAEAETDIEVSIIIDGTKGEEKAINCQETLRLPAGATVLDALQKAAENQGYELVIEPPYVKTIGGLGEGSFGLTPCGWMFSVNGEMPPVAAEKCVLENGSEILWEFAK